MKIISLFLISMIAISVNSFLTAEKSTTKDFCTGIECPEYTLLKNFADNIEIREYKPSTWVSTNLSGGSNTDLTSKGFRTLFSFIQGGNNKKQKMSMSAPVRTKHYSKQAFVKTDIVMTESFYIPDHVNVEGLVADNEEVFIENGSTETTVYAVISYSGYSKHEDEVKNLITLGDMLKTNEASYIDEYYFVSQYNSPFNFWNRHNEIWIQLK